MLCQSHSLTLLVVIQRVQFVPERIEKEYRSSLHNHVVHTHPNILTIPTSGLTLRYLHFNQEIIYQASASGTCTFIRFQSIRPQLHCICTLTRYQSIRPHLMVSALWPGTNQSGSSLWYMYFNKVPINQASACGNCILTRYQSIRPQLTVSAL